MQRMNVARVCAAMFVAFAVCLTAYAEDGYIESKGNSGVCLGHRAGPNTKLEVDFAMTELVLNAEVFGSGTLEETTSASKPRFFLYTGDGGDGKLRYSWDYTASDGTRSALNIDVASVGNRRTITFDANTLTYTSVAHGAATGTTHTFSKASLATTHDRPLSIFGSCYNQLAANTNHFTAARRAVKMKCYGVKIYESGTLVKNFVPCVKGGVPGLKETINNRFVTGADVEALDYGGNILVEKDDPYISTIINTNSIYLASSRLAGTSIYFLTDYFMKKNSRLELDYALQTPHWSRDKLHGSMLSLITAGSSSQKMYISTYGSNRGDYYCTIGSYADAERIYIGTEHDIRRTVTVVSNGYDFITAGYTNISKRSSTKGITSDLTSYQVKLACNQEVSGGFMPMKIYGLKIYESNALIKDFRPFVTNGVAGLIDRLNPSKKLFPTTYCNNNKTNVVADAGGDIDREGYTAASENEAYLKFDGVSGHNINTGYVITPNSCVEADFSVYDTRYNGQQGYFKQDAGSGCILARLYLNSEYTLSYQFEDWTGNTGGVNTQVSGASNERRQFKLDGHNNHVTIKRGDEILYSADMTKAHTYTGTAKKMVIGDTKACMKLYGFKISESGTETRNFVPCVTNGVAGLYELHTNTFFPLTGGTVSGKGYKGQSGEFEISPQPATLMPSDAGSTATLTCLAAGAQSYEWYEDNVLMPGETSDTLTLNWERAKAKMDNHTHTYSVKPVYTVFNEKVVGDPVTATVEYTLLGMVFRIR